jgi:hypothetical protein
MRLTRDLKNAQDELFSKICSCSHPRTAAREHRVRERTAVSSELLTRIAAIAA